MLPQTKAIVIFSASQDLTNPNEAHSHCGLVFFKNLIIQNQALDHDFLQLQQMQEGCTTAI